MNIYEKILKARKMFLNSNVKKTGQNKFQKFKYFELDDIVPTIINITDELKLCPIFNFNDGFVSLTVVNAEDPKEDLIFTSPIPDLNSENINKTIQNIGSIQTYQRRYLYMQMFDIVENDSIDVGNSVKEDKKSTQSKPNPKTPKSKKKPVDPKPKPKEEDIVNDIINNEVKGSRPNGKAKEPEVMEVKAKVPYQKVLGISTALDQWINSITNKNAIKEHQLVEQAQKLLGTDTLDPEEMKKIRQVLDVK